MKRLKQWCAALLAAVLALVLIPAPASAAGPTKTEIYQAYYEILRAETERLGIIKDYSTEIYQVYDHSKWKTGVFYARLLDFDQNGVDELLLMKVDEVSSVALTAKAEIYTYANGRAVLAAEPTIQEDVYSTNIAFTLTQDANHKFYWYEASTGNLIDDYYYYTLVNGQWTKVDTLTTYFHPDIYISYDVFTSTGTYSYKINGQDATQAQYSARRQLREKLAAVHYTCNSGISQSLAGSGYLLIPSDTVNGVLWALGTEVDESYKALYSAPSAWAAAQVNAAIGRGIVPAEIQQKYGQPITRAQFCALAANFYEQATGAPITERATFSDTSDPAVQKMAGKGIVTGIGDGKFNPGGLLTRESAAVILVRLSEALGNTHAPAAPSFADSGKISSWASAQVGQCQAAGIMGGTGNNSFDPQGTYTREQSIVTVMRMEDLIAGVERVALDKSSIELLGGGTETLTASIFPENAANQTLTWKSSDEKVAVFSNGTVTAKEAGTAVITVTAANGVSASCQVTVLPQFHVELKADLPATVSFFSSPYGKIYDSDATIDYKPDNAVIAGSLTLRSIELVERRTEGHNVGVKVSGVVASREPGFRDSYDTPFVPYIKWVAEDVRGRTVDSGLSTLYGAKDTGSEFSVTFFVRDTEPGETYTIRFLSDEGTSASQNAADPPRLRVVGAPLTVTKSATRRTFDGSLTREEKVEMTLTVSGASLETAYDAGRNSFTGGITFTGSANLNGAAYTQGPKFSWTLEDESGDVIAKGSPYVDEDGPFTLEPAYQAKNITMAPGQTYTLRLSEK